MQKLASFSLVLCLALGGCQAFKRSDTWSTVTKLRVDAPATSDPSEAYAEQLHGVLLRDGVPHRVVSYSYTSSQRFQQGAGSRSAVVYEDHTSPGSPYWLADSELARPVWLPDSDLETQLKFYARSRAADVISSTEYLTNSSAKDAHPVAAHRVEQLEPHPAAISHIKPADAPRDTARPSPLSPVVSVVTYPVRYVIEHFPGHREPECASAPPDCEKSLPEAHHSQGHESPQQKTDTEIFREKHGSKYNPKSAADRRKMEKIKNLAHR